MSRVSRADEPEVIKKVLAAVASPEARINEKQQLDAGPNSIIDRPFVDKDLPELPGRQRGLAEAICKSLPPNAPVVVKNCLQSYSGHLLAMELNRSWAISATSMKPCMPNWTPQKRPIGVLPLAKLFERFFANHEMLRTHFPLKHEEVIAQFPIDDVKASGAALGDPFKEVEAAIRELRNVAKATPEIVRAVANNAAFANDLATLPRPAKGEKRPLITVKQRDVLGSIGFLVTIYNLIGTTASIYGLPEGASLMKAVGEAIQKYLSLLL